MSNLFRCTPDKLRDFIVATGRSPTMGEIKEEFGGILCAMVDGWTLQRTGRMPIFAPRPRHARCTPPPPAPPTNKPPRRLILAGEVLMQFDTPSAEEIQTLHALGRKKHAGQCEWGFGEKWIPYLYFGGNNGEKILSALQKP